MDIPKGLEHLLKPQNTIHCVDMHTTGEATRILYKGYPLLNGTLLEQRAEAKNQYDYIRRQLMLEPRGHAEMYGAILRHDTELTDIGKAHIGVLFMTNEGYSTMCGHATIALGRFLVDTQDLQVFPRRKQLQPDEASMTVRLNLHAPCGLVEVTVPVDHSGTRADASRPVSFIGVPSFVTGGWTSHLQTVRIFSNLHWPALGDRDSVPVCIAYGGAFFCIVSGESLGLPWFYEGKPGDLDRLLRILPHIETASRNLKHAMKISQEHQKFITHPSHEELSFLYSVIVTYKMDHAGHDHELGICFFGDDQLDRSPTGSAVAARVALELNKGAMNTGERRTYHSLLSLREVIEGTSSRNGAFVGEAVRKVSIPTSHGPDIEGVLVKIEGFAYYTGLHTFVVEQGDKLGQNGFLLNTSGKLV